jgi:hypothetical protein
LFVESRRREKRITMDKEEAREKARQRAWAGGAAKFINYGGATPHRAWLAGFDAGYEASDGGKVEWVPCSEKLPPADGWYLITNLKTSNRFGQPEVSVASYIDRVWRGYTGFAPLAWMPLPQPYTEPEKETT